jgi:putative oxidoreductase
MMFSFRLPGWAVWMIRLLIAGTFIYAGAIKLFDPAGFAVDIDNYHLLPWAMAIRLAFYLPWLEIACGLAVLFDFLYRGGVLILATLITVFIAASIIAKTRGLDITCGCFGHASKNLSFVSHLAIDLGLLAGVVCLWLIQTPARKPG